MTPTPGEQDSDGDANVTGLRIQGQDSNVTGARIPEQDSDGDSNVTFTLPGQDSNAESDDSDIGALTEASQTLTDALETILMDDPDEDPAPMPEPTGRLVDTDLPDDDPAPMPELGKGNVEASAIAKSPHKEAGKSPTAFLNSLRSRSAFIDNLSDVIEWIQCILLGALW